MIKNKTARKELYNNHNGQWSATYAAASSGLVENWDDLRKELTNCPKLLEWVNLQSSKLFLEKYKDQKEYFFLPWAIK